MSETQRIHFLDESAITNIRKYFGDSTYILRKVNPHLKHARKYSAYPPLEVIKLLLDAGIDVNIKDQNGKTALHKVVASKDGPWNHNPPSHGGLQVIKMLFAEGADPSARDSSAMMPLHQAALATDCPIMQAFLDGGSDINARMTDGMTPLFEAVSAEHAWHSNAGVVAAKILLYAGADVHIKTSDGRPVLHEALLNKKMFGKEEVKTVTSLLDWGVDARIKDLGGETALDLATKMGDTELVKILRGTEHFGSQLKASICLRTGEITSELTQVPRVMNDNEDSRGYKGEKLCRTSKSHAETDSLLNLNIRYMLLQH